MDKVRSYLDYSVERAIKTIAQTAIAVITGSQVLNVIDVDWGQVAGIAALAGVMSLLTSVLVYDKPGE
jgi:hypothetical protein|tara:strand:- start:727 stop:930 length:204 start_codon:yes stop_codon:yes gene_type:complete